MIYFVYTLTICTKKGKICAKSDTMYKLPIWFNYNDNDIDWILIYILRKCRFLLKLMV